ncbi:MAG TPA: DMT family transporter [Caulobacteraceae bacterium]|nr:DMT family transporter [Caulobacteraceae bacterium]
MTRPQPLDWLVLAALVIAWGSAFGALKIAVAEITPAWNTVARLWVASAVLAILCLAGRQKLPRLSEPVWVYYAAIGLVGMTLPFFLFAFAAKGLPSAVNAICNGASPIFTAVLAYLTLREEPLGLKKSLGVLLGFIGLMVLVAPRLAAHGASVETLALAAALTGGVLYAVSNIITRKAPPVPSSVGGLMMCLVGAVVATVATVAVEPLPPAAPSWPAIASIVGLGVFSTALGSVGYVFLVKRQGPVFMSMAIYLAPLWATFLGVALLGERPGWPAYTALALILLGVGLATASRKAA